MIIKSIKLTNFRNHTSYKLECKKDTTLILGKNGSGKTSVLEAIYILTRGKSFRATDAEIIKIGKPFYRAEITLENGESVVAIYDNKTKTFLVSDKKTHRLPKTSRLPVVLFEPSDLNLISHSPSRRRDYFNRVFSDFNEMYHQAILKYDKALKQRNEILKSDNPDLSSLFSWDLLLAKYGSTISNYREHYVNDINQDFTKTYRSIAKTKDEILIDYKSDAKSLSESNYLKQLEKSRQKDIYIGHTSFGIHRDDYIFIFNQKPADGSASRGEIRSIILALKFIEAKLIEESQREKPIILLDDVFSELDQTRRECLITNFRDHQVIITSVEAI